jgi:hypothetical protein
MKALKISFTLFFLGCALQLFAQNPLVGTWERNSDASRSVKIITPTHWILFQEDLKGDSIKFRNAAGGLYTLTGDKYVEHINLGSWADYGKEKTDFTYKVAGDKFYMKGPLTLGDGTVIPLDEVWQKVSSANAYPKNPGVGTWNQLSSSYTGEDGKKESHTNATATRFEVISPTHWMRISHRDNKFENAMGGSYTMDGEKMILQLDFASFPFEKESKAELTQQVKGDKRYVHGMIRRADGKTGMSWDDVFQKAEGKSQTTKKMAKK